MRVTKRPPSQAETPELRRLRRQIDALDRRIVALLNERAELSRAAGRAKVRGGGNTIRDSGREREVLLRATMANQGPLGQSGLLALDRRLLTSTRAPGARDRARGDAGEDDGACRGYPSDLVDRHTDRTANQVRSGTDRLSPSGPRRECPLGLAARP